LDVNEREYKVEIRANARPNRELRRAPLAGENMSGWNIRFNVEKVLKLTAVRKEGILSQSNFLANDNAKIRRSLLE
jgi:hypothetical protein